MRSAVRCAHPRTGWIASATTAAAIADATVLDRVLTNTLIPATIPTYTTAMNTARTANTTVLRITTSMS